MITVLTEPTTEPVTLQEVKDWLGITGTNHDTKLTAGISAARKKVEQLSGRSLAAKSYQYEVYQYEDDYITLPYPGIASVDKVTVLDVEANETELESTDYTLIGNRLYYADYAIRIIIEYTTESNSEEFYKLAIKKQLAYDYRNAFTENGFDKEVISMISTDTLNTGW